MPYTSLSLPDPHPGSRRGPFEPSDEDAQRVRDRLAALDFPAFARCAASLLESLGYEDVRLADRVLRGERRNRDGGYDLLATTPRWHALGSGPLKAGRAVAQLRRAAPGSFLHRRQIDEAVGAAVRAGAAEAVLVTTNEVSPTVERRRLGAGAVLNREPAPGVPTVRIFAGEELAALLLRHGVEVPEPRRLGRAARPPAPKPLAKKAAPPAAAFLSRSGPPTLRLRITLGLEPEADEADGTGGEPRGKDGA